VGTIAMKFHRILLSFLVAALPSFIPAYAQVSTAASALPFLHYADKARGWHWKEAIPVPEEPPAPEPPAVAPPAAPAKVAKEPEGPRPMSAEWIRQNMPKYLDAAIDDPTPQNVSNYLYLQKYSMDAADRFSQVSRRVVLEDPNLDENNTRPVWVGGSQALEASAAKSIKTTLQGLAQTAGLWFFFRSDCEACHVQAPVLDAFAKKYGFTVFPISLDGGPLANSPFKSYVVDQGQGQKLGVQYSPSIFLAKPPNTFVSLTQGLVAMPEIETRLLELATQSGLIDETQYQTTRSDKKNWLPPMSAMTSLTTEKAADPNYVRNHLKALISNRKP